ncbi:DUF1294 domain-containing protein [Schnuerera sp. xch1]|uniref:DUF1294 domain-containing protein n=1 Tax=Schnuerera sp. xch1 TaxID=2874283 RepID=UPI001CC05C62|nr:DUF1294 domain-containing protein [Schnuerera sp. xch1]MBZ2175984.1 DUF1294 domain-containing protein [Schnuerera sp. xch1]
MNILSNYNNNEIVFLIYLLVINLISFSAFMIDKFKARKNGWRISEISLIVLALVGGSIGALLGMIMFKHKTNKTKFSIGIPLILIINKIAELAIFNYFK